LKLPEKGFIRDEDDTNSPERQRANSEAVIEQALAAPNRKVDTPCEGEVTDVRWRLDAEGGLAFHVVELITTEKAIRGIGEAQPWQKISD